MSEEIISEKSYPLPCNIDLKTGKGTRNTLDVRFDGGDDLINFYNKEQLYMHVSDRVLGVIVATKPQDPKSIANRLKNLVKKIWS